MSNPPQDAPRRGRIGDRLNRTHQRRFVGRSAETELFRQVLQAPEPPFSVLHLYGPGGIGKTTLLRELARIARDVETAVVWIDGRNIEPSPAGFLTALHHSTGDAPLRPLADERRTVLVIDTYEVLAPLDTWLRETFLPDLPERTIVVIAGRHGPASAWQTDAGWQDLVRTVPLRNLQPEESRSYLTLRGVPEPLHSDALAFAHGHPLALSLAADVLLQGGPATRALPEHSPDLIQTLLDRFVERVPSSLHRQALQVCAHVRVTTEPVLAAGLEIEDSAELFEWLRNLSFVEHGPHGLFPHDLVRDALDADLRWRNPELYQELHRRVRQRIVSDCMAAHGLDQQRIFFDLFFLHRHSPFMKPFHDWATLGTAYAEPASPSDEPAILEMVLRHEGEKSARIARHWLHRQPRAFIVFRGGEREIIGFIASLALHEATEEDRAADPAVEAAERFMERTSPLRPGDEALYHRFMMGRDAYQQVSQAMSMVPMVTSLQWLTNPRLAWSFIAMVDPGDWEPQFAYIDHRRAPVADFVAGGKRYTVFTHDWRVVPALAWLDLMSHRELAAVHSAEALPTVAPALMVLSQPDFAGAVRQALRDFTRPAALANNPLMRSRLVLEPGDGAPTPAKLRDLIREAVDALGTNPKDERLHRVLHRTYLEPAGTQELAAELLGLPFSTYRYQLAGATERVTDWLWQRELHGDQTLP